jgi:L-amino acid N-acyltransferase
MRIRLAELADAEAIRAIYNVEVLDSTNTFDMVPRSPAEQEAWILRHSGVHPAIVAIDPPARSPGTGGAGRVGANGEIVLGFGSLSAFRERSGYSATAENSVYVDRAQRGRGVGKALLTELLALASAHGFHSVVARIAGHNETSIGLHRAAGFELVGVEREVGRKHRQWLDVVELQRLL